MSSDDVEDQTEVLELSLNTMGEFLTYGLLVKIKEIPKGEKMGFLENTLRLKKTQSPTLAILKPLQIKCTATAWGMMELVLPGGAEVIYN